MPDRWHSVGRMTSASTSGVLGLLRFHPQTAMTTILALAYPASAVSESFVTELVVGSAAQSSDGGANIPLEWCLDRGASRFTRFSGVLIVTPMDSGTRLELRGVVRCDVQPEDAAQIATLSRVLSWLALATESAPSAEGT